MKSVGIPAFMKTDVFNIIIIILNTINYKNEKNV